MRWRLDNRLQSVWLAGALLVWITSAARSDGDDAPAWSAAPEETVIQLKDVKKGRNGLRMGENGFRAFYRMNRDGSDLEFFAAAPGMIVNTDPFYSHDGKQVVFSGFPNLEPREDGKIFVVNAEEPMKGPLCDLGYGMEPVFSPDDKQIAFGINPDSPIKVHEGVWVMDADGTHHRWLAEGYYPRWSPDGKKIVYQSWEGGGTLGLVDVATGKSENLLAGTDWTANMFSGGWSPDGKQIAFAGKYEKHDRVGIVDLSKPNVAVRAISTSDDPKVQFRGPPAWSPDGKQLMLYFENPGGGLRGGAQSYLCSMSPEVPCGPVYLEPERNGNINRSPAFSPDSKRVIFSSER